MVGVVEDGKYRTLTEDQQPAMFFSIPAAAFERHLAAGAVEARSGRDCQGAGAHDAWAGRGLPFIVRTWNEEMSSALFAARVATVALGVLGTAGRDAGGDGHLWHGLLHGEQTAARAGHSHGAGCATEAGAEGGAGAGVRAADGGLGGGIGLGILAHQGAVVHRVPGRTKDPAVLGGVVLTMLLLGLAAAWMPAQRALAVNPMILMREE